MCRFIAALLLALGAVTARATPQVVSGNELWIMPEQSGWGVNIFHQGDTLFASLFLYDLDNKPRWYTASDLRDIGGSVYTGALYESWGPWFGGAFDPRTVTRRQVGTVRFELGARSSRILYVLDGVTLLRTVVPFTFEATNLSGSYAGFQAQASPAINDELSITIQHSGSGVTMLTQGSALGSCTYTGSYSPHGKQADIAGTYTCSSGARGNFNMLDVEATVEGFTSRFSSNRIADVATGRMGGTRNQAANARGPGAHTGLYYNPDESGWGLNLVEQGDSLFGTLFVYDTARQARWYSASQLVSNGTVWTGDLYESMGPYFGTTWFPSMVSRRKVGTLRVDFNGRGMAAISYTIDGVGVSNQLVNAAFRANDPVGTYVGHIAVVPPNAVMDGIPTGATAFTIENTANGTTIRTHTLAADCTFAGARSQSGQYGELLYVNGTYACTNGKSGNFYLDRINVTYAGFTAMLAADGFGVANVAGTRTGPF